MPPHGKVFNPKLRQQTVTVVKESKTPVGVAYVTRKLNEKKAGSSTWATTRAILLDLVREGKLMMTRTSSNFVFWMKDEHQLGPVAVCQKLPREQ